MSYVLWFNLHSYIVLLNTKSRQGQTGPTVHLAWTGVPLPKRDFVPLLSLNRALADKTTLSHQFMSQTHYVQWLIWWNILDFCWKCDTLTLPLNWVSESNWMDFSEFPWSNHLLVLIIMQNIYFNIMIVFDQFKEVWKNLALTHQKFTKISKWFLNRLYLKMRCRVFHRNLISRLGRGGEVSKMLITLYRWTDSNI